MGRLLRYAIATHEWRHRRAFEAAADHPVSAQMRVLRRLLGDNADTAFGREGVLAPEGREFARRVPIGDYEAFRPWVARIVVADRHSPGELSGRRAGREGVLAPEGRS